MIILNDIHIGVERQAGTTPQTAQALRMWLLDWFDKTVTAQIQDICIMGDLFDKAHIPYFDMVHTFSTLANWLKQSNKKLYLVPGNHDLHTNSEVYSSFQSMSYMLQHFFPTRAFYISEGKLIDENIYVIPHKVNQAAFDEELAKVPFVKHLLVHCNYDNFFARQSDNSLNMSKEQAIACKAAQIYFAHEHASRQELSGRVVCGGNNIPSSVSDCLDGKEKFYHEIDDNGDFYVHPSFRDSGVMLYEELDWKSIANTDNIAPYKFIRVVGEVEAEDSAMSADMISNLRNNHSAFVISNAVKMKAAEGMREVLVDSIESLSKFDIKEVLKRYLTEKQYAIVESLK